MSTKKSRPFQIFELAKQKVQAQWDKLTSNPAGVKVSDFPVCYEQTVEEVTNAFGSGVLPSDLITIAGTVNDQFIAYFTQLNYRADVFPNLAFQAMNPNTAVGYPNDAISALSGAYRQPARATQFTGVIKGSPNTTIPSLSLVISTNNGGTIKYSYVNVDTIVLDGTGSANALFICQTIGETPLAPNTTWTFDSFVQGISSVTNPDINLITIGNDATTDPQLRVLRSIAINARANCGLNSIQGQIVRDAILASQITTVLVPINNSDTVASFPQLTDVSGVYSLPKFTLCPAVVMPDTDDNKQALGKILLKNITGCNTGYPLACPENVKRYVDIQFGQSAKRFYFIIPVPQMIQFTVTYQPIGFVDPTMESKIKQAILTQFNDGTNYNPNRTIGGEPFYINTFAALIQNLGLYNATVTMKIKGDEYQPAKIICLPLWLLPVCDTDNIVVVTI